MSATYSVTSIPDLTSLFEMAKEDSVVDLSHSARQAITQKKSLQSICLEDSLKNGGDLLSHGYAVPSARPGLTSLFGMGRGRTPVL